MGMGPAGERRQVIGGIVGIGEVLHDGAASGRV